MGAGAIIGACANAGTAAPRIDATAVVEIRDSLVRVMIGFLLSIGEMSLAIFRDADLYPTSTHIAFLSRFHVAVTFPG
jgi:hypothetical protein